MTREQETRQELEKAVSAVAQWANAGHILIPLPAVAQQLGMTRQALYYWMGQGQLKAVQAGGKWYIKQEEVDRWRRQPMRKGGLKRRKGSVARQGARETV